MDDVQRAFYGLNFQIAFLGEKGKAFEAFFARVMAHAFSGDFQPVRPYGNKGDLKCDGFRVSDGSVFQCYAPDSMKIRKLLTKSTAISRARFCIGASGCAAGNLSTTTVVALPLTPSNASPT